MLKTIATSHFFARGNDIALESNEAGLKCEKMLRNGNTIALQNRPTRFFTQLSVNQYVDLMISIESLLFNQTRMDLQVNKVTGNF